jgi:hypothetical protein
VWHGPVAGLLRAHVRFGNEKGNLRTESDYTSRSARGQPQMSKVPRGFPYLGQRHWKVPTDGMFEALGHLEALPP